LWGRIGGLLGRATGEVNVTAGGTQLTMGKKTTWLEEKKKNKQKRKKKKKNENQKTKQNKNNPTRLQGWMESAT